VLNFRILAAIYVLLWLFMLEGVREGRMPWTTIGCPGCVGGYHPEVQRWHGAEHGAMIAILLASSMLALVLKPRERPLLMRFTYWDSRYSGLCSAHSSTRTSTI
jgi:hypothetical protein